MAPLATLVVAALAIAWLIRRREEMWTGYHQHFLRNPHLYRRPPSPGQIRAGFWLAVAGMGFVGLVALLTLMSTVG
jgi:hypothetical protein